MHGIKSINFKGMTAQQSSAIDVLTGTRFIPSVKIAEVDMEGAVRRAVVEILALKEASRPLTDSTNALQHTTFDYSHVDLDINNGTPTLRFEDDSIRSELLDSMPSEVKFEERAAPATAGYDAEEHNRVTNHGEEEAFDPNAHGWYGISLDDGHFKFAVRSFFEMLCGRSLCKTVTQESYAAHGSTHP